MKNKEITKVMNLNEENAKNIINDKDKMEKYLERIEDKVRKIKGIGPILADITLLISLVRSYIKGKYKAIPITSIIGIVAVFIYFISPVDLIPATIPLIGALDDLAMLRLLLNMVEVDLELYKEWKDENIESK